MKRKWTRISSGILILVALAFLFMPSYIQEALTHWYPNITDTYIFESNTVKKADSCWDFPASKSVNTYQMSPEENTFLEKYETVAYLVVQQDSILYEEYRDKWTPQTLSNIFSATKSIVGLLVGIAYDEGYIENLDDNISLYLPKFEDADQITVRNLLTMSSGLNWDEAYTSLFSKTTQAYYGDNIRELMMNLKLKNKPGKRFSYQSGDTQLLSFVLEAALQKGGLKEMTISEYAETKLWKPLQTGNDALWNLDRKGGDEKTYCCFNTTARDIAHLARLVLNNGNWNGKQLISEAYIKEAISPASYLENQFGDGALNYYGFQIWITHYKGMQIPVFRGLGGQYIFMIPQKNAIVVRLGHKRDKKYKREKTAEMDEYLDIAFRILEK